MLYVLLFLGLVSGNLWVYPEKISQGWDATLAHLPYHQLRKNAIQFLEDKNINFQEVGTFFPNYTSIDEIDLNDDSRFFEYFNQKNPYIFYSNVYNVSDEDYDFLQENYYELKRFKKGNVYVSLLKMKDK